MPGPVIKSGERVVLRTVERNDAEFLQRSHTDPRIRFSLGSIHHGSRAESEAGIEGWIEGDSTAAYIACLNEDETPDDHTDDEAITPIGSVSARHVDGDRPWLAYWLLPEFHGEGYGGEMVRLAITDIFSSYPVHGISAGAYDFNEPSRGLLESLGFREEACRRQTRYIDGEYRDEIQYGLMRREWES